MKVLKKQQGFAPIIGIIIVVVAVLLASGGIYWYSRIALKETFPTFKNTDETANWLTYRNENFGYEIKYPSEKKLKSEEGGRVVLFTVYEEGELGSGIKDYPGDTVNIEVKRLGETFKDIAGFKGFIDSELAEYPKEIAGVPTDGVNREMGKKFKVDSADAVEIWTCGDFCTTDTYFEYKGSLFDISRTEMADKYSKDYDLMRSTFKFVSTKGYANYIYEIEWVDNGKDEKLIRTNNMTGEEETLIPSVKSVLPTYKYEEGWPGPHGLAVVSQAIDRFLILKEDTPEYGYILNKFWLFDIKERKLIKLASQPDQWGEVSPGQRFYVFPMDKGDEIRRLGIIDFIKDTKKVLITLPQNETLTSGIVGEDVFAGPVMDIKWWNNNTLQYKVYEPSKINSNQKRNPKAIRSIEVQE